MLETAALLVLLLYSFGYGLRKGASVCVALCLPSIFPTLVREGGWLKGLKVALAFNAPRILALTALGVAIGASGYVARGALQQVVAWAPIWSIGYAAAGSMMLGYGLYTFAKATERFEDIEEGKGAECAETKHPFLSRLKMASPTTKSGLVLWGAIVSIACVGETALALEGILIGMVGAGSGADWLVAALLGGGAFFLFSLGASTPSLAIASLGSALAEREKRERVLLRIEQAAAILMMVFGALFLVSAFYSLV
ncbi:MAG: hypothetical protein HZB92_00620 [Euryarchaeota archaeon]|nr:hypothetical protein [Euryarchaeota archaeon]